MARIGIIIAAKDMAGKVLRDTGKAVRDLGAVGDKATRDIMHGLATLNQVAGLARRGFALVDRSVGDLLRTSLEYRDINDPVLDQLKEFERQSNVLKARLGDALLPAVRGLMVAFGGAGDAVMDWVKANRQAIGAGAVEWAGKLGGVLIDGVASGVSLVARAWAGWSMLINTTKAYVNAHFSVLLSGVSAALGAMAKLSEMVGAGGLATSLQSATGYVSGLGAEFSSSATDAGQAVQETSGGLDALETRLESVRTLAHAALNQGVTAGMKYAQRATEGATQSIEEQAIAAKAAADTASAASASAAAAAIAASKAEVAQRVQQFNDVAEANKRTTDRMIDDQRAYESYIHSAYAAMEQAGETFASSMIETNNDIGKSLKTTAKAAALMILDMASNIIMVYAAQAAAAAFASQQWQNVVPGVGVAAGLALAAVVIGMTKAYISQLPAFARGGLVTGGVPGRDSVPILAMPGERVLSVQETRAYDSGRASGGGGASVNVTLSSFVPATRAQTKRHLRDSMLRSWRELARDGGLVPEGAV